MSRFNRARGPSRSFARYGLTNHEQASCTEQNSNSRTRSSDWRISTPGNLRKRSPTFEQARQTLKALASEPGCQVSQAIQFKNALAEIDYNVKVAADADTVRFAAVRREVIEEAYEIYDKLSFVQPLALRVQRIYADGCFNKAVYPEQDGLPIDVALLRKSEHLWDEFNRAVPGGYEARGFLVIVRRKLAEVLESRGELQEAAHWRAISLTTAQGDASLLFEIALEYARMLAPVDQLPLRLECEPAPPGSARVWLTARSPCFARPSPRDSRMLAG